MTVRAVRPMVEAHGLVVHPPAGSDALGYDTWRDDQAVSDIYGLTDPEFPSVARPSSRAAGPALTRPGHSSERLPRCLLSARGAGAEDHEPESGSAGRSPGAAEATDETERR